MLDTWYIYTHALHCVVRQSFSQSLRAEWHSVLGILRKQDRRRQSPLPCVRCTANIERDWLGQANMPFSVGAERRFHLAAYSFTYARKLCAALVSVCVCVYVSSGTQRAERPSDAGMWMENVKNVPGQKRTSARVGKIVHGMCTCALAERRHAFRPSTVHSERVRVDCVRYMPSLKWDVKRNDFTPHTRTQLPKMTTPNTTGQKKWRQRAKETERDRERNALNWAIFSFHSIFRAPHTITWHTVRYTRIAAAVSAAVEDATIHSSNSGKLLQKRSPVRLKLCTYCSMPLRSGGHCNSRPFAFMACTGRSHSRQTEAAVARSHI